MMQKNPERSALLCSSQRPSCCRRREEQGPTISVLNSPSCQTPADDHRSSLEADSTVDVGVQE